MFLNKKWLVVVLFFWLHFALFLSDVWSTRKVIDLWYFIYESYHFSHVTLFHFFSCFLPMFLNKIWLVVVLFFSLLNLRINVPFWTLSCSLLSDIGSTSKVIQITCNAMGQFYKVFALETLTKMLTCRFIFFDTFPMLNPLVFPVAFYMIAWFTTNVWHL